MSSKQYSSAPSQNSGRRSQRIELSEPLSAVYGVHPVKLIELSEDGAAIEHAYPLAISSTERLRVESPQKFEVTAIVRHSVMTAVGGAKGPSYRSGLSFHNISEEASAVVEAILVEQAAMLVRLWEANAAGQTSSPAIAALHRRSVSRAPSAYIWMRLINGKWERSTTLDPNQPLDGFSVPASEDPAQIALLCRTYETASIPERKLLRALAQYAIAEAAAERRRAVAEKP